VKDLLERVFKQLPGYLPDLCSLVTRPKTAILRWIGGAAGDLTRPFMFVAVSVAIGFLLQLPQLGKEHDFATLVTSMAMFKLLALGLFAAIIHVLFLAVGGRASFTETFSAYLYVVSPLYLVLVILETATFGVLHAYDPVVSAAARLDPTYLSADAERMRTFMITAPRLALAYGLLNYTKITLILAWFIACWGAFRRLHVVVRWRSALAGITTLAAAVVFFSSMNYILLGMFGTSNPALR
jgi:Yip1 domain